MAKKVISPKEETIFSQNSEIKRLYRLYIQEFANLNADNIKFYLESAQKGINFFKAFLFDEIRRKDLRIAGLCQTRKLAVLKKDWFIDGKDQTMIDFINQSFANFNFQQLMTDIVEAQLQGLAIFKLDFDVINNKLMLNSAEMMPNYSTIYDENSDLKFIDWEGTTLMALRQQAYSYNPNVTTFDLDPIYHFVVYNFDGVEQNGLLNGIIDSVIWGFFFKIYGLKDWSVYLERFATPAVMGKYDPLMNEKDKITLWNAVQNFGNLFKIMLPNTAEFSILSDTSKSGSGQLYEQYIKSWNDELSIRILGQAMTTDTHSGGSFAKAQVGNYVREDLLSGDLSLISHTMNQLIKRIININFPNVSEYPVFQFSEQEDMDYRTKKADVFLKIHSAGFDIDPEDITNEFDIIVTPSAAPAPSAPATSDPQLMSEPPENIKPKKKQIEKSLIDSYLEEFLK